MDGQTIWKVELYYFDTSLSAIALVDASSCASSLICCRTSYSSLVGIRLNLKLHFQLFRSLMKCTFPRFAYCAFEEN